MYKLLIILEQDLNAGRCGRPASIVLCVAGRFTEIILFTGNSLQLQRQDHLFVFPQPDKQVESHTPEDVYKHAGNSLHEVSISSGICLCADRTDGLSFNITLSGLKRFNDPPL